MQWPRLSKKKKDLRRSPRVEVSCLEAVFWDGSTNSTHAIREISLDGAIVVTPVAWFKGTMIRLSIRRIAELNAAEAGGERIYADMWCRVVRRYAGGFCIEFMYFYEAERKAFREYLENNGIKVYGEPVNNNKKGSQGAFVS